MLWTIAAIAALQEPSAEPPPVDPCPVLQRLVDAAREPTPFVSVQQALARGEVVVPGYEAGDCRVEPQGLVCGNWSMNPRRFAASRLAPRCPGLTVEEEAVPDRFPNNGASTILSVGGVRIEYGTRCLRCAGPGSSYFRVMRP